MKIRTTIATAGPAAGAFKGAAGTITGKSVIPGSWGDVTAAPAPTRRRAQQS